MGDKLFSEINNILRCIVDFNETDTTKRSEYFTIIQKHAKKTLINLEEQIPEPQG
jgi:hypothetical protein